MNRFILSIYFLLAMSIIVGCVPSGATPSPTPTAETMATISYPTEGGKVDQTETVKGSSQNIPESHKIWIVLMPQELGNYFPSNRPAELQANGDWASICYFGNKDTDANKKFDILVVLANETAQSSFRDYLNDAVNKTDSPGLPEMPDGALIYHRITVTRK